MRLLAELEPVFELPQATADVDAAAAMLLQASEEVLEHWVTARGDIPTKDKREGFRLLACIGRVRKATRASMPAARPAGKSSITTTW